jgi:hypothetical protein
MALARCAALQQLKEATTSTRLLVKFIEIRRHKMVKTAKIAQLVVKPILPEAFSQTRTKIDKLQIIASSGELFNHVDNGLPMWSGDGDRSVKKEILFVQAFAEAPNITLGLTGIDAAHDQNLRFRLQAIDVKATGFTAEFTTWDDTHIARASMAWQAIGKTKPDTSNVKHRATMDHISDYGLQL